MKPVAVQTYNANLDGRCEETFLKVGIPEGKAEIVIGGPPSQPFSQIGCQRGNREPRLEQSPPGAPEVTWVLRHWRAPADCFGANPVASALGNRTRRDPGNGCANIP